MRVFKTEAARKLVNVNDITHEQWLFDFRSRGIGGSEAATIAGLGNPKYDSSLKVYQRKIASTYQAEPSGEAAEMGHIMEPVIRDIFKSRHPEYEVSRSNFMWQSIERTHCQANVDGVIYDPVKKSFGVFEAKNLSEYRSKEFGEKTFAMQYQIQIMHYMYCLGLEWGWFAIMLGGQKYREYYIERNDAFIESLMKLEDNFWYNHVLASIPPEPDGSEASKKALQELYDLSDIKDKTEILTLSEEVKGLTDAYEYYKAEEAKASNEKEKVMQQLQALLGTYQTAQIEGDEKKIHWSIKRTFDAVKVRESHPDLYKEYIKPKFDSASFKKAYPNIYEECMKPTKTRSFSYK
ncbi:YqaJ viral recombinase family nuclease [Priestia megaterium]